MFQQIRDYVNRHQKYIPVVFFITGFIWDSMTLGRIDRLYDRIVLCSHVTSLSLCLYLYNVSDDGKWKATFFEKYEKYLPLAIQFFLGGLCSAYVVYFSRSVSMTKTSFFFMILVVLLFANEVLKQRISNKYLQFSAYFFVNFTFFTFFIPVLVKTMGTFVFLVSGLISLVTTVALVSFIYKVSPSTQREISAPGTFGLIAGIYLLVNGFYFLNLIPPVPLALEHGIVAHEVQRQNGDYVVTYEEKVWYKFWRDNNSVYHHIEGTPVYLFTSIFAPTDLKEHIFHRWKQWDDQRDEWIETDRIGYEITGGRDAGFRGFTNKSNITNGLWRVDVITENNQVLGFIKFVVEPGSSSDSENFSTNTF